MHGALPKSHACRLRVRGIGSGHGHHRAESRSPHRGRRRRGGAAPRRRRLAHAARLLAGARRAHRRARVPQGRDPAAHRLVQVPRRLQQASLASRPSSVPAAWWPISSGNHAQGVAAAAKLCGMPAVIVMPRDAPRAKRERTAALGAEVVLYDREREDREAIARKIAEERGATLVPPYDDPLVIAGQGTAGREIVEDLAAARAHARTSSSSTPRAAGSPPASRSPSRRASRRRACSPPSRRASTITPARSAAASAR